MKIFAVKVHQKAQKNLEQIPVKYKERIEGELLALAIDPYIGKKLKGALAGSYSMRVWPYRILYQIYDDLVVVYVLEILHRKDVYK